MDKQSQSHRSSGFTLVELLVVIGIIALLVGVLMPALGKARKQARLVQDQSNLRQIALSIFAYASQNDGMAPLAAPQELGGPQGIVPASDPWLVVHMFGGFMPQDQRPLNAYIQSVKVFESPCDRGEPLWWFDTADYQATSTCYQLYGTSYYYASGYNQMGGVVAPMGLARFVGPEFSFGRYASSPLPLAQTLKLSAYPQAHKKVLVSSIPLHRTMSGVVAINSRAQWYKDDPDHLWANAAFADGHVEFVRVFPYDWDYQSVNTVANPVNPYY